MTKNSGNSGKPRGRQWPKGVSGNPKGRPPLPDDVKAAWRAMHKPSLETIRDLIAPGNPAVVRLRAAEIVQERVEGRVAQGVEHNVTGALEIRVIDPYALPPGPKAESGLPPGQSAPAHGFVHDECTLLGGDLGPVCKAPGSPLMTRDLAKVTCPKCLQSAAEVKALTGDTT